MFIKFLFNILEDMMLLGLALDLLYLYSTGAWYDPMKWLELLEVYILIILAAFSVYRFIMHIREVSKHG
jgi:hypothetical protein